MFVARRTANPEADLARGWSAFEGEYAESPLDLSYVENEMAARDLDIYDVINDVEEEHGIEISVETEDGWEIIYTPGNYKFLAEWICDRLNVDVCRCPVTGLYAVRHHNGLSCYELTAETESDAIAAATEMFNKSSVTWLTGGHCGLNPTRYFPATADVYVFVVEETTCQADS